MNCNKKNPPSYESEVRDCDSIFKNILRNMRRQPGYDVDFDLIRRAYETAKRLHGDTRRHSGVLYLRHPLSVMNSLSRLKCKASLLASALLHDTMEDCDYQYEELRSAFNDETAEIVSAVTAIKAAERETEESFKNLSAQDKHDFLDKLTDAKLVTSKYQREAFLLRFADREHNLSTLDACKPAKRRLKIEQTKAFLIPAAHLLGMRYYETSLSDYCLKFAENPTEYNDLLACRNQYITVSGFTFTEFDAIFQQGIQDQTYFAFPSFNPFARLRGGRKDGAIERRRRLLPYELKCQVPEGKRFSRQDICMNEVIITCEDQSKQEVLSHFIHFFETYLHPHGMFFEYLGDDEHSLVVKLTDMYENNYRIVIIPTHRLETYFIGDPNGEPLTLINDESISDALRPKITVYACSSYKPIRKFEGIVPQDSTALDFAFIINPALGRTVRFAQIKKWNGGTVTFCPEDYNYPLKTVLEDGDVVHFVADYDPRHKQDVEHATIDWFGYVNTEFAKNELIKYFKALWQQFEHTALPTGES